MVPVPNDAPSPPKEGADPEPPVLAGQLLRESPKPFAAGAVESARNGKIRCNTVKQGN